MHAAACWSHAIVGVRKDFQALKNPVNKHHMDIVVCFYRGSLHVVLRQTRTQLASGKDDIRTPQNVYLRALRGSLEKNIVYRIVDMTRLGLNVPACAGPSNVFAKILESIFDMEMSVFLRGFVDVDSKYSFGGTHHRILDIDATYHPDAFGYGETWPRTS